MELRDEFRQRIAVATKDVVLPPLTLSAEVMRVLNLFVDFFGVTQVDLVNSANYARSYDVNDYFYSYSVSRLSEITTIPEALSWIRQYPESNIGDSTILTEVQDRGLMDEYIKFGAEQVVANLPKRPTILVYYPQVTITNEENKSIDIYKLFVKINLKTNGKFHDGPYYKRSSYPAMQLKEGYRHSHTPSINRNRLDYMDWGDVCTGRGPINETKRTLSRNFDEMAWNCFIWELDKIVHIESIAGVPYYKMSNLGSRSNHKVALEELDAFQQFTSREVVKRTFKDFLGYYFKKKTLKFKYINGQYALGQSLVSYYKDVSDNYIEWYNLSKLDGREVPEKADLFADNYLQSCILIDNSIYTKSQADETQQLQEHIGNPIIKFKGVDYCLEIPDLQKMLDVSTKTTLLSYRIMNRLLIQMLNIINTKYGKETNSSSCESRQDLLSQSLQAGFTTYK